MGTPASSLFFLKQLQTQVVVYLLQLQLHSSPEKEIHLKSCNMNVSNY
jgi:hypothetical protein